MKIKIKIGLLILGISILLGYGLIEDYKKSFVICKAEDYIKAVHYFGDEWPINFWNSELDNIDMEFANIRKDGFNTIILVIPWREFQTGIEPIEYSEYTFEKLDVLFKKAQENKLEVIVRVGYTWDFYEDESESILDRYYLLMSDHKVRKAWEDYIKTIYQFVHGYENFRGGFICWEDFWNNVYIAKAATEENRLKLAKEMGYQTYLKETYSLEDINTIYGVKFNRYDEIYIPEQEQYAFRIFYEFYDAYLMDLLMTSQQYFPNLSMEVRTDADLVKSEDGDTYEYYSHTATYECGNSDFTTIVYGIPMGFENKGERVSAEKAQNMTSQILSNVKNVIGDKSLFVDQFLFVDNTPAFSHNAQIKKDELDNYLISIADTLTEKTGGYGIWTYRDYRSNMLYNSQFALGMEGWEKNGDEIEVVPYNNSNKLLLKDGNSISQYISDMRNHFPNTEHIYFEVEAEALKENSLLKIALDDFVSEIKIEKLNSYLLELPYRNFNKLKIESEGEVRIDNIYLYTHIQEGELYDVNRKEESCIKALRKTNGKIDKNIQKIKQNKPYYSFIEQFDEGMVSGDVESDQFLNGHSIGIVMDKEKGKSIYMTPNTAIEYRVFIDSAHTDLILSYGMNRETLGWGSDGAQIIIEISEEEDDEVEKIIYDIEEKETMKSAKIDLKKYTDKSIYIKINCSGGKNGNEIADWVMIYELALK